MSSDQNPCDIPAYWWVNGDLYNGLLQSLYNWVVAHPPHNPTNRGELITAHMDMAVIFQGAGHL